VNRSALQLIGSIALGNALVPLNSTMLVVALPFIARDAGTDLASASWLITTYLIAMAALQPIGGRIGDRFGRRGLMLAALAYFGLASIGAALAHGLVPLIFFRLQQAIAGALIVPNGMGILRAAAGQRAGMHFGILGAVAGTAASIGPLLGGLLVAIDWRLVFLVNVPVIVVAIALALVNFPEDVARTDARFDIVGVIALALILTGAAWVLTSAARGVDLALVVGALVVVAAAVAFVRYESRLADPALPPMLFLIREFTAANVAISASNMTLYATLLAIPALLASDPVTAVQTGVALFALSAAMAVLGPFVGMVIDRFGAKWPPAFGGLLIVAGCLATSAILASGALAGTSFLLLLLALLVMGAGVSFTFPATRVAAVDAVPQRYVALASGVVSTSRYFGGMIGAIVAGAALTTLPAATRGPTLFVILASGSVLTSLASLGMPGRQSSERTVPRSPSTSTS
jgi:EmrB/QacA subfamily drug resistance transporter